MHFDAANLMRRQIAPERGVAASYAVLPWGRLAVQEWGRFLAEGQQQARLSSGSALRSHRTTEFGRTGDLLRYRCGLWAGVAYGTS